jgi:cytidylate kinase
MKAKRGLVLTVAGPHGSGRSTQAARLAETFELRYVSTGILFRERAQQLGVTLEEMTRIAASDDSFDRFLDDRAKKETRRGGIVLDATLSGWVAAKPDLRFYLTAPLTYA